MLQTPILQPIIIIYHPLKGKQTAGEDLIPAFLLKDCATYLAPVLHKIINIILKSKIFPDKWKVSKIVPVLKSGDNSDINNYRPISIISNVSKIFERVIHNRLYPVLHQQISTNQHGFIRGRSTTTNLMHITQVISSALDNRLQVDVLYTDFSKAFDSINHQILLHKLNNIGACDSLLQLFFSYLDSRSAFVSYNNHKSHMFITQSGVPQGSILGPLLFLLFINDLILSLNCSVLAYADDLKMFNVITNVNDCEVLQRNLDIINHWCDTNCISLNINKCNVVSYCKRKNPIRFNYSVQNSSITRTELIKDLGVLFDSSLTFSPHVNKTRNSALQTWGFIKRTCKDFTQAAVFQTLYYSLIRPKLEYACLIWCPFYKKDISLVERVQGRYLKFMYFKMHRTYPNRDINYTELLQQFDETSLNLRRSILGLTFLHGLINNKIDAIELLSFLNFKIPTFQARKSVTFCNPIPHTNILLSSPINRMCNDFNLIADKCDIFFSSISIISNEFSNYDAKR